MKTRWLHGIGTKAHTSRMDSIIYMLGLLLAVLIAPPPIYANDINVVANFSETQILTGERFTIRIEVRGNNFRNVNRPTIPSNLRGVRSISLQPSTSTQYSLINGVATRSFTYTWTFVAESAGTFEFPPVTVEVDGNRFRTAPVSYTIIDRNASAGSSGQQAAGSQQQASGRPDVFLQMEISDQNPVIGQQIFANLVIYFKNPVEVVSYQASSAWSTDGFWKENLSDGSTPRAESVILGGERYRKAVLSRHALFPTRAGNLTIGEATITTTVRSGARSNDPFSSFFSGFGTNQRTIELKTEPVNLSVRRLPDAGDRKTIGAVGNFTITRRVSPSSVMAGEALEIITEIRGNGNLALINKPQYDLPDEFEVFQPQETLNIVRTMDGIGGNRTFRDILIVRRPGVYELPPVEIAYFDPARRRYNTLRLPAEEIQVRRDEAAATTAVRERTFSVNPVTGVVPWKAVSHGSLLGKWWMYVGLVLPVLLLILAWKKKREDDRLRNDSSYARRVRARDNAMEALQKLRSTVQEGNADVKQIMTGIHAVLYRVVTDRLDIQEAGHSDADILRYLREHNVPEDTSKRMERLLNKCSTIRFAPVTARENLPYELDQAEELVNELAGAL
ncbi:MAG: protein BatD [Bacteroidetes bacterium]|nr:protein BatD [Bacteroidota bacterium]MCH8525402.1 BatD family protein [Balneolales bacterium]